nr:hypothetical protein [uncultured Lichenicoccus sp.]
MTGLDRYLFGRFDDFETLAPEAKRTVFLQPSDIPDDGDMLHGHIPLSAVNERYPDAQLLALLREARVRLLSHYLFWRSQSPAQMAAWGRWGEIVAISRRPLVDFLTDRRIVAHTDNMALRMLLWPHPLIPDGDFIDPKHDETLLRQARTSLSRFDHVDIVENDAKIENLSRWLGRPVGYPSLNKVHAPTDLPKLNLQAELSEAATQRLAASSRLDAVLWATVVQTRLPQANHHELANQTFSRAIARYATD